MPHLQQYLKWKICFIRIVIDKINKHLFEHKNVKHLNPEYNGHSGSFNGSKLCFLTAKRVTKPNRFLHNNRSKETCSKFISNQNDYGKTFDAR